MGIFSQPLFSFLLIFNAGGEWKADCSGLRFLLKEIIIAKWVRNDKISCDFRGQLTFKKSGFLFVLFIYFATLFFCFFLLHIFKA